MKGVFLGLLLATDSGLMGSMAQTTSVPNPFLPQTPDLSSSDPSAVTMAALINRAFDDANRTGVLPSMPVINGMMAQVNPAGTFSALQTLTRQSNASSSTGPAQATLSSEGVVASAPPSDELLAAQAAVREGFDDVAYGDLAGIAYQLQSASDLAGLAPEAAAALLAASNQLFSFAYFAQGDKGALETAVAQKVLVDVQNKESAAAAQARADSNKATSSSTGNPQAPSAAAQWYLDLANFSDPRMLYGSWLQLDNTASEQILILTFAPTEYTRVNVSRLANGHSRYLTEGHSGSVLIDSDPTDSTQVDQADGPGHKVAVLIKTCAGEAITLNFIYLKANNGTEFLIEQEHGNKAFVRMAPGKP